MILTIKPFGAVDSAILDRLRAQLGEFGTVDVSPAAPVRRSMEHRNGSISVQFRASEFERACEHEPGDRVLAVTDVDLFDDGLDFVFGHATIHGRFAVISIARFGSNDPDKVVERATKTAIHELGHTFGLYHDDANPDCVMHFSERLEHTDRKGRAFCRKCRPAVEFTLSRLRT